MDILPSLPEKGKYPIRSVGETVFGVIGMKEKKIVTDPNGSYTGRPKNPGEIPVQDVDDL